MIKLIKKYCIFTLLFLLPVSIQAIQVKLLKTHINTTGPHLTSVTVINASDSYKAVEVSVMNRKHDIYGVETHSDAEDFIIIPPQLIMEPHQSQSVVLRWIGDVSVKKELPYRVIVEEVPLKDDFKAFEDNKSKGKVKLLLRFMNSFYIRPAKIQERVELVDAVPTKNRQIAIKLVNKGNKHAEIFTISFKIKGTDKSNFEATLKSSDLNGGINLLPYDERIVFIPIPADLNEAKAYSAKIVTMK